MSSDDATTSDDESSDEDDSDSDSDDYYTSGPSPKFGARTGRDALDVHETRDRKPKKPRGGGPSARKRAEAAWAQSPPSMFDMARLRWTKRTALGAAA